MVFGRRSDDLNTEFAGVTRFTHAPPKTAPAVATRATAGCTA